MQRLFDRVAAHFTGSAALHSDTAPASDPPGARGFAHAFARFVDRCESSPDLLGEEKAQDALVIAFFAAFSLIGWMMVIQGCEQLRQAQAVAGWPAVEGTIIAVDAQATQGSEGARLRPRVTYAYTVNSRVVVAARIADPNTTGRDSKDYVVHNYLPQAPVTVHYNPAATSESVLDATVPRSAYLNLILGTGFACLGLTLFMLIAMPASRRRGWLFWRRP